MTTVTQNELDETAACGICNSVFADPLAWCAHRPWKSVTHRDGCKWPKALRKSSGVWSLRPSCREAVRIAEEGPPNEYRINWPTLTPASKKERTSALREVGKNGPHNHAASSVALAANEGDRR